MFTMEEVHVNLDLRQDGRWNLGNFYRPQRSWGKVMFLHVSVILFTAGGSLSRRGLCPVGGLCPGGGGLCPGGSLSRRPPRTVMRRRYASYWNAFLFRLSCPIYW